MRNCKVGIICGSAELVFLIGKLYVGSSVIKRIVCLCVPGELSMEKVKVKRYVSGKRPDYAPMESSDEEEEDFQFVKKGKEMEPEVELEEEDVSDPRLRRLLNRVSEDVEERWRPAFTIWFKFTKTIVLESWREHDLCLFVLRLARHRQIAEPEVVVESSEDSDEGTWHPQREESSEDEEEEEEEVDDEVPQSLNLSVFFFFFTCLY